MSHLISSTSCSYIVAADHHIVHREHYDALGQQISTLQLLSEHQGIKMIPQPSLDVLFPRLASPGKPFISDPKLELLPPVTARPSWSTVMILHSSGSTKFPKPIHLHRTAFQEWLCGPGDASPPVTGMTISSMAWPSKFLSPTSNLIVNLNMAPLTRIPCGRGHGLPGAYDRCRHDRRTILSSSCWRDSPANHLRGSIRRLSCNWRHVPLLATINDHCE